MKYIITSLEACSKKLEIVMQDIHKNKGSLSLSRKDVQYSSMLIYNMKLYLTNINSIIHRDKRQE